jgi:hypothetical protein
MKYKLGNAVKAKHNLGKKTDQHFVAKGTVGAVVDVAKAWYKHPYLVKFIGVSEPWPVADSDIERT